MSQRNFNNARNQGNGPKGSSRKSASSAKIKGKAGSSVYVRSKKAQPSGSKSKAQAGKATESKGSNSAEQVRRREQAMVSMMRDLPEYKTWRRAWWILMVIAFLSVMVSWLPSMLIQNGVLGDDFRETTTWFSTVGFIFAIVALIGAFYIDLRKIRKLQKSQEAKARNLSKAERQELDRAIEASIERGNQRRAERKAKLPWNKKKGDATSDDSEAKPNK